MAAGVSHSVQAAVIRFLIEGGKLNAVPGSKSGVPIQMSKTHNDRENCL